MASFYVGMLTGLKCSSVRNSGARRMTGQWLEVRAGGIPHADVANGNVGLRLPRRRRCQVPIDQIWSTFSGQARVVHPDPAIRVAVHPAVRCQRPRFACRRWSRRVAKPRPFRPRSRGRPVREGRRRAANRYSARCSAPFAPACFPLQETLWERLRTEAPLPPLARQAAAVPATSSRDAPTAPPLDAAARHPTLH